MAGVKGRSGRRPYLQNKTLEQICRMSASSVLHALRCRDENIFPYEKRVELAKHFVLKAMPNVIESDGSLAPKTIVLIRNDKALLESAQRELDIVKSA